MSSRAYIGLGSNLDNPRTQIRRALAALHQPPEIRCLRHSSLYETAPMGFADQPVFINAVAELSTTLTAGELMLRLRAIESAQGRVRSGNRNGPRTLDLDVLLFADARIAEPDLEVPHPRMMERAFVLLPLLEIAPEVQIPGVGAAGALLSRVSGQDVKRLDP